MLYNIGKNQDNWQSLMKALSLQEINDAYPEKAYNIESFVLNINTWSNVRQELGGLFHDCLRLKFDENIRESLPKTKGIYIFFVEPNFPFLPETRYLMYVGKVTGTNTFFHRFNEYVSSIGNLNQRQNTMLLTNLWPEKTWVYVYPLDLSDKEIESVEDNLIDNIVPPLNNRVKAKSAHNSRSIYF